MKLKQVKPKKIYEEVADQLKAAILSGRFLPGDKLPSVRELSEQLSVGQPSVREAITSLKAIGLLEIHQGEGTFVAQYESEDLISKIQGYAMLNKKDVENLYEVRRILEVGAAGLAAKHRTEAALAKIKEAVAQMERSITNGDGELHDWAFHFAIAEATQNPVLVTLMESISERTKQFLRNAREALFNIGFEKILLQHEAVLNAIEAQDAARAQEAMIQHLNYVEQKIFSDYLEK